MEPTSLEPAPEADRPAPRVAWRRGEDVAAWKPPGADRFTGAPANDLAEEAVESMPAFGKRVEPPSDRNDWPVERRWMVIIAGAVLAALAGALIGGGLAV